MKYKLVKTINESEAIYQYSVVRLESNGDEKTIDVYDERAYGDPESAAKSHVDKLNKLNENL